MKCIQRKYANLPNGKKADMAIQRVSNEDAHLLVTRGEWKYVPKHEYKAQFVKEESE